MTSMMSSAADDGFDDNDNDNLHVEQQPKHTTPSQDKMLEHMAYLQMTQGVPRLFWKDFLKLNYTYGTIRNNLSKLNDMGLIEKSLKTNIAYYSLPKDSLQNSMTTDYLPVTKPQLAALIKRLVFDTPAVHNIWLEFHCPTIYDRLRAQNDKEILILPGSKKLVLQREILENGDIEAQITVSTRNNVIISLACSENPIHFDIAGLVRLTSCLTRIEERLRSKVCFAQANLSHIDIPHSGSWIVVMWHVGMDSKERYTGETYEESWKNITGETHRIYAKLLKKEKKRVLRLERQEYPNNPLHDAVEEKLSTVLGGPYAAAEKKVRVGEGV
jgi:DNA-binding transcriptional ArsR family regulator